MKPEYEKAAEMLHADSDVSSFPFLSICKWSIISNWNNKNVLVAIISSSQGFAKKIVSKYNLIGNAWVMPNYKEEHCVFKHKQKKTCYIQPLNLVLCIIR